MDELMNNQQIIPNLNFLPAYSPILLPYPYFFSQQTCFRTPPGHYSRNPPISISQPHTTYFIGAEYHHHSLIDAPEKCSLRNES